MNSIKKTEEEKPPVFSAWGIWYILLVLVNLIFIVTLVFYFQQFK